MAGAGNVLGSKFSEISAIIREVKDKTRVGVCLDTCHMFAVGYDIRTKDGAMMSEFSQEIGFQYLRGMHINDSKGKVGSGKDRYQNLGLGHLTLRTFAHVLSDPRTQDIPLILETPAHDSDEAKSKGKKSSESEGSRSTEWEVWKKEVEVLGRLATLGRESEGSASASSNPIGEDERDRLLDEWTNELKAVVVKYGGSAVLENESSKKGSGKVKGEGKGKQRKKLKADEEEEDDGESDGSC
ncbi:xylose isomerase-like protein [Irpex rosettiformis]|uniref:Xylose isomerase-like protein n=1 Tax=Irpex rosettiformis TaxID=378272 RepID=A0ACB8TW16_9APHY|nr:xylose isomerase-like protein [Irpex rosettiformis]